MANSTQSREKWRRAFAAALTPLADSVTQCGFGGGQTLNRETLDIAEYRTLLKKLLSDDSVPSAIDRARTKIDADPEEAIDLLKTHPSIGAIVSGKGSNAAVFAIMPGTGFKLELEDLAKHASVLAISQDEQTAAAVIDEFLSESIKGRLPGFEVAVIQGVSTSGIIDLGPGTRLTSYVEAIKLGLVPHNETEPFRDGPDFQEIEASVLFREFTWSPGLIAPKDFKHPLNPDGKIQVVEPTFIWDKGPLLWALLDILSMVSEQGIDLLSISTSAPQIAKIHPSFRPGGSRYWNHETRNVKQLREEHVESARNLYALWSEFHKDDYWRIQLALARLVSAVRRGRDRFWLEDRIFDVAVSLEVMFGLGGGELTYKLATRCAWLLGKDDAGRAETFDAVSGFYKTRSRIIHGSGSSKMQSREHQHEVKRAARQGFEIAQKVFIALLNRGIFPDWKKLSLGVEQ